MNNRAILRAAGTKVDYVRYRFCIWFDRIFSFVCSHQSSLIMVANHSGQEGLRQRTNASSATTKLVVTEKGRELDKRLDNHET